MNTVIRVQSLGKKYELNHSANRGYVALRDVIANKSTNALKSIIPFRQSRRNGHNHLQLKAPDCKEDFWALKDITFDVNKGDRIGILGRNGAGKSTLLKILSRITEPSAGRVEIRGRVASLLEVGTGFHPELTGRENIYLNGAILGMTRREIKSKFDEIVDFAEVERFLDTPVKRYSSGMYVRLAFAVAAHLEPDILIVDEVLAVGDAGFQAKCLGKLEDVTTNGGRTVLFVSHQMAAISKLCQKSLLLSNGVLVAAGATDDIITQYSASASSASFCSDIRGLKRMGCQMDITFSRIDVRNDGQMTSGLIRTGSNVEIDIYLQSDRLYSLSPESCRVALGFFNDNGVCVVLSSEMLPALDLNWYPKGEYVKFSIPKNPLTPGLYRIVLFLEVAGVVQDWITQGIYIEVEGGDFYGSGRICPTGYEGKCVLTDYSVSLC